MQFRDKAYNALAKSARDIEDPTLLTPQQQTIDTYDRTASKYAQLNSSIRFWKAQQEEFAGFLEGSKILDAGCGHGRDTNDFIAEYYNVTGIDLSEGLLVEAKKRVPNGSFIKMDFADLKFPDNSFDGIWCAAALLHIKKSEAGNVLKGFRRVLRENGVLFISVKSGKGEVIKKDVEGNAKFFANYTKGELDELVGRDFDILSSYERSDKLGSGWICAFASPNAKSRI